MGMIEISKVVVQICGDSRVANIWTEDDRHFTVSDTSGFRALMTAAFIGRSQEAKLNKSAFPAAARPERWAVTDPQVLIERARSHAAGAEACADFERADELTEYANALAMQESRIASIKGICNSAADTVEVVK